MLLARFFFFFFFLLLDARLEGGFCGNCVGFPVLGQIWPRSGPDLAQQSVILLVQPMTA